MAVALDVRVATSRQQQPQPIAQQRRRLRAHVAPHPDWHVAAAPISRDDGSRGATRKRPGLERRDRAALAAVAGVGITAPDRVARPSVQPMLVVDARTQRGWRVAGVERPMDDHPHDPLLLQRRGAVAEYARPLSAERRRRGRQAPRRRGQLLPWPRAPYGALRAPDRPRDPSRGRMAPVQAAVVEHRFAWDTDPSQAPSLSQVAKRLRAAQMPTPRGGTRWNGATVRGMRRAPTSTGGAASGRSRRAPARRRQSALPPVGASQRQQPAPAEAWMAVPVPAIIRAETGEAAQQRVDRHGHMARRNNTGCVPPATHDVFARAVRLALLPVLCEPRDGKPAPPSEPV